MRGARKVVTAIPVPCHGCGAAPIASNEHPYRTLACPTHGAPDGSAKVFGVTPDGVAKTWNAEVARNARGAA